MPDDQRPASRTDRVEAELVGPLRALGLDLEAVELTPAGKRRVLRVAVDQDGGVSMDDVAAATREVGRVLDESDAMGEGPYTLEVTSRGVDRPLTLPRHWRRNTDRLVRLTLADGDSLIGRVLEADEAPEGGVRLDPEDGGAVREVGYAEVARALVEVEFNRPGRAEPDEPDDDDEYDENDDEIDEDEEAQA